MPINTDSCSELKSSVISLELGKWQEGTIIYYKRGPKWKIEGNTNPKIRFNNGKIVQNIETYTIIPEYDQTGNPPHCSTLPDNYSFKIKNGKIMNFYGGTPPHGNPKVDIFWYDSGPAYLSFYSSWTKEETTFPTTMDIYVSVTEEPIITIPRRIETGEKKLWKKQERPIWIHGGSK
jgi:hypothetical protein